MPTIARLLTPPGRGAIATISVQGDQAMGVVQQHFRSATRRSIQAVPLGRILFGTWLHNGGETKDDASGEELVVCRRREDYLEINCHGGKAASSAILQSLERSGCDLQDWQDESNVIAHQARIALSGARSVRAATILLNQFNGVLEREVQSIIKKLDHDIHSAQIMLQRLADYAEFGLHLTDPWKVVLVGPPNVGKSSLINALLGFDRSIVYDLPGTTRDVVTAQTTMAGIPMEISDTAGLRETEDDLESAGVGKAGHQVMQADLVVVVQDIRQAIDVAAYLGDVQRVIHVKNKCDLVDSKEAAPLPSGVVSSATEKIGIEALMDRIVEMLTPAGFDDSHAVPFTSFQRDLIDSTIELIDAGKIEAAIGSLNCFTSS